MKGNPVSTFPPYYQFHIGEVIQIWLAGLMRWGLGSSHIQGTTLYAGLLLTPEEGFELRPRICCPSSKTKNQRVFFYIYYYIKSYDDVIFFINHIKSNQEKKKGLNLFRNSTKIYIIKGVGRNNFCLNLNLTFREFNNLFQRWSFWESLKTIFSLNCMRFSGEKPKNHWNPVTPKV